MKVTKTTFFKTHAPQGHQQNDRNVKKVNVNKVNVQINVYEVNVKVNVNKVNEKVNDFCGGDQRPPLL